MVEQYTCDKWISQQHIYCNYKSETKHRKLEQEFQDIEDAEGQFRNAQPGKSLGALIPDQSVCLVDCYRRVG